MSLLNSESVRQALSLASTGDINEKTQALAFLEEFQRSSESWTICMEILNENSPQQLPLQLFSAQTLRNKVTYDLNQLNIELESFKQSLLQILSIHNQRPVVTQLNVVLARLAVQWIDWKDPISEIIRVLTPTPATLLGFLRVLPEETRDASTTPLSQDEFDSRVHELINSIADDVMAFLINCVEMSSHEPNSNFQVRDILECLGSWCFEFSMNQLLNAHNLITLIFETLSMGTSHDAFDAAAECLIAILKESRDTENDSVIIELYKQIMSLKMHLLPNLDSVPRGDFDDPDLVEGITRIFVEAGESWSVFITRYPKDFEPLVATLLQLCCKNDDLDVAAYTFPFWFTLKQNLVLPRYREANKFYAPVFTELINGIIIHLQYPTDTFSSKESEDKFKEFRYYMGDVLKDCAAVVGTEASLAQPLAKINEALSQDCIWQRIEAPLFSLRTMAQEVSLHENNQLPEILRIICNLPEHPKIRYAATLVMGRYTEWTSKHPETLEMQLNYIFNGFQLATQDTFKGEDLIPAASQALMYFCTDCSKHLSGFIDQLIQFFLTVQKSTDIESQFELCQGLSAVIANQTPQKRIECLQQMTGHIFDELNLLLGQWKTKQGEISKLIADQADLLFALFEELKPQYEFPQQGNEPLLSLIEQIWSYFENLIMNEGAMLDEVIIDRATKLIRRIIEQFHQFIEPILENITKLLVLGYSKTGFGSYLWCSSSIIVIFGDDESFPIPPLLKDSVWLFALSQCETFVRNYDMIGKSSLNGYAELIMDFFTMTSDLIMFYPKQFILSDNLMGKIIEIAIDSITKLDNPDAYVLILRCVDDILSWGFRSPPISTVAIEVVPDNWRIQVLNEVVIERGRALIIALFVGLISAFESSVHSDATSCLVKVLRLSLDANNNDPSLCIEFLHHTVELLGHVTPKELENLQRTVISGLTNKDYRKVRGGISIFVSWFLKKNVKPRCS